MQSKLTRRGFVGLWLDCDLLSGGLALDQIEDTLAVLIAILGWIEFRRQ